MRDESSPSAPTLRHEPANGLRTPPKPHLLRGELIEQNRMTQIADENRDPQLFKLKVRKRRKISVEEFQNDPTENPTLSAQTRNALGQDDTLSC